MRLALDDIELTIIATRAEIENAIRMLQDLLDNPSLPYEVIFHTDGENEISVILDEEEHK